ncbi:DHH family phosphoesterase [Haloprofundus sp. MHR1]|uniref:DHH family phosphoesterase n=1 Tax=Haloprofundus sp. MHR1 TaxID=2572921 RepID=UPI0010BE4E05|nr:OB-fold nucleic acid binding domain-containing protein [Haloprofundus sp. MHR1]QCJ46627.1 S1 RNA-binding domain-containing protein [Haloprofundus sp. MHR1]
MGTCIICGTPVEGRICDSHQEDVVFEFRGNEASQLTPGRFYSGVVDGYADFGVFVDLASGVTGLLHRSELDRRLESLDWEPGDTVFVQVKNVRDNGNIDLGWSIRQSERDFRGALVQDADGDHDAAESDESGDTEDEVEPPTVRHGSASRDESSESDESDESDESSKSSESSGADDRTGDAREGDDRTDGARGAESEPTADYERVEIGTLSDRVGQTVRIEGEVVSAQQTGGPTVFEVRDETGVVDAAAFVEAGVRAYPEVDVGSVVRLDGEVELRHNEIQVETEALVSLEGDDAETVQSRLDDALRGRARPDDVTPLADHDAIAAVGTQLQDAAEEIRRAVFESRPVIVRHTATADGYVAGAAVERAVLPLIREEHAKSDAEYHYFDRRPLEEAVYGMDAATNDVTRMLQDRDRHGEKLPLVLLVGTGSTVESSDGLDLLSIYGAKRVVADAAAVDAEIEESTDVLVSPVLADADASDLSTGALVANLAAAVNDDVRDDLRHLPAVSYWEDAPQAYLDAATDAGYDETYVRELREAVALEAYYQSYEDKRELITDLLFDNGVTPNGEGENAGNLASHVSEQFRLKLDAEVETAKANLESREAEGVQFAVLDTDAYTHRFDFPPTALLLDELHRREREGEKFVTVGVAMDELYLRSTADVDLRAVAEAARERAPEAGITAVGIREGRIEFLSGRREQVKEAVVEAVAEQLA